MANDFSKVTARELDLASRFATSWDALEAVLGISNPIKMVPGIELVAYTANSKNGLAESPAAGVDIPVTDFEIKKKKSEQIVLEKYRKRTTAEDILKYGASIANEKTDNALIDEMTVAILDKFYTFLQTGTLTDTQTTFQMAVSMAIGKVVDKFKKLHKGMPGGVVVFVNTLDVYKYLGSANVTIQNQFGVQYIKDFMGASSMILSSEIPEGKVIATPVDNLDLYYIAPNEADLEESDLVYTVDGATNLVGVHVKGSYGNASSETFAIMGMKLWAEYLDGISVVTINAGNNETPNENLGA
jgi:hypothetical protein